MSIYVQDRRCTYVVRYWTRLQSAPFPHTGYFRKVYRSLQVWVPHNILKYLHIYHKVAAKAISSVHLSIEFNKKKLLCFNFITTLKYFRKLFISFTLNVHNDPCFEDKSSSLTLKYRPVHLSENSCMLATALRSGHVLFVVREQMYDGRSTINTACNILFNVSYILCFSKYTYRLYS